MIINGTRPIKRLPRRKFHKHFGGISSLDLPGIPDFNVDTGLWMPDQDADNAPTECTGYTTADILSDSHKKKFSPDFSYAVARWLGGDGPGTDGADYHVALQGAVAMGVLEQMSAPFSAFEKGELYVSDLGNYSEALLELALMVAQNGTFNVLGNGDAFDSIMSAVYTGNLGVSIGTPWYPEWSAVGSKGTGIMPVPNNISNISGLPWHNWAIKGKKTIDNVPYLVGKVWQGEKFGDNGWTYFDRETINEVLSVPGTGALSIKKDANRVISIIVILITNRFPVLIPMIPKLIFAVTPK